MLIRALGAPNGKGGARVGVDVGGTFTDLVLVEEGSGKMVLHKEPSTPENPAQAVLDGFLRIAEIAGVSPASIAIVAHGTTVGLNAIIQRSGARTALVTSRGSRDVLELARCRLSDPLNLYPQKETPLVPREWVFETSLRFDAQGNAIATPDEDEIRDLAEAIRQLDIESVAVSTINGYLVPAAERAFAARLGALIGDRSMTVASEIWPEMREYERTTAAVMNAYISPLMVGYLNAVEYGLAERGFRGHLLITTSNGGTLSAEVARQRPVETILSGPAGGVVATAKLARQLEERAILTVDMGGTSSDMAVLSDFDIESSTRAEVGGFPLFMPVASVNAIGAGGGSLLWVDEQGVLKVGPQSAGSRPGPACYGRGGETATITDCFVVCGFIDTNEKLAGTVTLHKDKAYAAISRIAEQLGDTGPGHAERTAWAALRVATSKMATELQKGLAARGANHTKFALVPFGGAGPTQAALLAKEAKLGKVIVPPSPGIFCALGAVYSDLKRDFSKVVRSVIDGTGSASRDVAAALEQLRQEAAGWLATDGRIAERHDYQVVAYMRYRTQSYDITVPLGGGDSEAIVDDDLVAAFSSQHHRIFGYIDADAEIGVSSVVLTAIGRLAHEEIRATSREPAEGGWRDTRSVFFGDEWHEAPILSRELLPADAAGFGPAVIRQNDTTTVVPPGWQFSLDSQSNIILEPEFAL